MSTIREAALALAAENFPVFPVLPGKKIPALNDWPNLATTDRHQVEHLFPEVGDEMLTAESNIGIRTGGTLMVLDEDERHGSAVSIANLQLQNGALPVTRMVSTPSGGRHRYFRVPPDRQVPNSTSKIGAGLDIRGERGYVLAPPSFISDKGSYALAIDAPVADAPPWLLDLAIKPRASKEASDQQPKVLTKISKSELIKLRSALFDDKFRETCADNATWSEVGYSLLTLGKTGQDLFCEWSRETPGYQVDAPESWWSSHTGQKPRTDWRHILTMSRRCGWKPSRATAPTASFDFVHTDASVSPAKPFRELQRSDRGIAFSNTHNALVLLQKQRNVLFWHDVFLDAVMVKWFDEKARRLADHDIVHAQIELQAYDLKTISREATRDAINQLARMHERDCVVDYLVSLEWDRKPRLTRMLKDSLGVEQNRLHAHAGRNLMMAAVARALSPGCKVDEMLVLEGEQGAKKTQWWEILGGRYYAELTADLRSKDFEQQLRAAWFAQHSELSALSRADIERVKQVTTCRIDKYRPSYGREVREYPRRCVFGGTTNNSDWLHDPTGGRRFIPIEVGKIDLEWLRENRDQLFAEAVVLYKRGYKWWYYPRVATLTAQQERMPDDPWLGPIRDYLCGRREIVDIGEVLQHALDMPADRQTKAHTSRVGLSLKALGCVRQKQRRIDGERRRPWSVPEKYASKPCHRNIPAPAGDAAFDLVPNVTAAMAARDLI